MFYLVLKNYYIMKMLCNNLTVIAYGRGKFSQIEFVDVLVSLCVMQLFSKSYSTLLLAFLVSAFPSRIT